MSDDLGPTMSVGGLELTLDESVYKYEEGKLKLIVHPGWKHGVAVVTVQYPSRCHTVQSAGVLPSVIESTLDSMRQELEQEVRRANMKLAAFNALATEIIERSNAQVNPTEPKTPQETQTL